MNNVNELIDEFLEKYCSRDPNNMPKNSIMGTTKINYCGVVYYVPGHNWDFIADDDVLRGLLIAKHKIR
jgi:hypothetical protein